jgi:hypothetical protein
MAPAGLGSRAVRRIGRRLVDGPRDDRERQAFTRQQHVLELHEIDPRDRRQRRNGLLRTGIDVGTRGCRARSHV